MLISWAGRRSSDQTATHLHITVDIGTGSHINILLLHLHVTRWHLLLLVIMVDDIPRLLLNIRINLVGNLTRVVHLSLGIGVITVLHLDVLLLHILTCNNRLVHLGLRNFPILSRHLLIGFQSFDSFYDFDSVKSNFNLKIVL